MRELDPGAIRERLLNACESYVNNNLPTHLIRLADMVLVTRNDFWDSNRLYISAKIDSIVQDPLGVSGPHLHDWCQKKVRELIQYAVFSHRWGRGEPNFRQLLGDRDPRRAPPPESHEAGYQKLLQFCEKAKSDYNCAYAWSDTCCINKERSDELEEAVRSMYRWYRDAAVCIVHLAESTSFDDFPSEPWFTRGWTLQELLAPIRMKFYGKDWVPICPDGPTNNDKESRTFLRHISRVTGIPDLDLRLFRPSCNRISEKMNWMSKRKTTRTEDIAYALIGIFDITMPVRYGEATWAFYRLLEAISQRCQDTSFLAWSGTPSPHSAALPGSPGCYAMSPVRARFLEQSGFNAARTYLTADASFSIGSIGLRVRLLIVPIVGSDPVSTCDTYALIAGKRATPLGYASPFLPTDRFGLLATRSAKEYALGVVDFEPDGQQDGRLCAGAHYLALLLRRISSSAWRRDFTENVVVLDCKTISLRKRVETIVLAHYV